MFTKLKELKLKRSEKRAIKLAVFVAIFVLVFNLVLYPMYQSYNDLKLRKRKLTKNLVVIQKKIRHAKDLAKKVIALRNRIEKGDSKLIQSENVELAQVFLEETISDLAKKRNLTVQRIYKERAKDEYGFKVVKARITVRGTYGDIIDFLYDIEKDPHYIFANSLIIRFYRGLEATVSVKGIVNITGTRKTSHQGGGK